MIDWLSVLLKPLEDVNILFKKFREESIYKVTHNGQVFSLQKVLNDAFDNELRRIVIEDAFFVDPLYIYPEADNKPVYIYEETETPVYIYDGTVFLNLDVEFVVIFPIELKPFNQDDLNKIETRIKGLVNYYKLASKRYIIQWI